MWTLISIILLWVFSSIWMAYALADKGRFTEVLFVVLVWEAIVIVAIRLCIIFINILMI